MPMPIPQEKAEVALSEIVALMSQKLPASESTNGWTKATWQKWQRAFEEVREQVSKGRLVPDVSITRAMDFDGVIGCEIPGKAAGVSKLLRSWREEKNRYG